MSDKDIIDELSLEMGKFTDLWGMGTLPGKIWAHLYFYGPRTQNQIKKELDCALGTISDALSKLENYGVIFVSGKEGRKNIYSASFSQKKKMRAMCETALYMHVNPMIELLNDRVDKIKNKEFKQKAKDMKSKYGKGATKMKLILKFISK